MLLLPACPQIGELPRLRELVLFTPPRDPHSYAPLERLAALRCLQLEGYIRCLPSCLPHLTWLEDLRISGRDAFDGAEEAREAAAIAARALPRLQALTRLVRCCSVMPVALWPVRWGTRTEHISALCRSLCHTPWPPAEPGIRAGRFSCPAGVPYPAAAPGVGAQC